MVVRETPQFKLFLITLYAAPLWWVLGLNLFIYHLATFVLFVTMVLDFTREDRGIYLPPSFHILLLISVIYAMSLAIHAHDADSSRVVASAYNLTFWVMGCMLVALLANTFSSVFAKALLKVFFWLALFIGGLAVSVFLASLNGIRSISYHTVLYEPFSKILGNTPLVANSLILKPLHFDWLASGSFPRFSALSPYATATGSLLILVVMMLISWGLANRKIKSFAFWAVAAASFFALFLTLSRTAVLAFLVSFGFVYFVQKQRSLIWLVVFIFSAAILASGLNQVMEWIFQLRAGATVGRFSLYRDSIGALQGVDWILGFGVKPREDTEFLVPLGSHSTYISMLFKTGLVGTAVFIYFQAQIFIRWFRFRSYAQRRRNLFYLWRGLGGVFTGVGIWMMTGDIDAPQLLAFLYFSLVGIFEALAREEMVLAEKISERKSRQLTRAA